MRRSSGTSMERWCRDQLWGQRLKGLVSILVFSFWYGVELSLVAIMSCQTLPLPHHLKANMDIDSRRNETCVAFRSMRCNYATPHLVSSIFLPRRDIFIPVLKQSGCVFVEFSRRFEIWSMSVQIQLLPPTGLHLSRQSDWWLKLNVGLVGWRVPCLQYFWLCFTRQKKAITENLANIYLKKKKEKQLWYFYISWWQSYPVLRRAFQGSGALIE